MHLAKILLPIHDGIDIEPMTRVAFAVADRFNAAVEALYPHYPVREQLILPGEAAAPIHIEHLIEEAEKQAKEAEQRINARFSELAALWGQTPSRLVSREGSISRTVTLHGQVSDIAVIGTIPAKEPPAWAEIRESAIFYTGRPVIVAPPATGSDAIGDTVIIAWKDGVESARALAAARPFLETAETVRVVTVGDDPQAENSLEAVAAYVSAYAKRVESEHIVKSKPSVAELLLDEAGKHPGALLVLGAYSQWRWKEWAFGGVTEYILNSTTVPVLMAH